MGILQNTVEPYRSMQGTHLYHAAPSNCSQRVRMVLEEKGVEYTSHLINLSANEHLAPGYQQLHPDGVVPALVHDGKVVIESNDIIRYVDERFPGPAMLPADTAGQQCVEKSLQIASDVQRSLKLISYNYLFAHRVRKSAEEMAEYARLQQNKELVAWQKRFNDDDFSASEINAARDAFMAGLAYLDNSLCDRSWLCGEQFGIADISWAVNAHRAQLIELRKPGLLQFEHRKHLGAWLKRVRSRPGFDRAVTDYEPEWSQAKDF